MFYSKFIFKSGAERAPQTPPQSPDQKAAKLDQRVQKNIDAKKAAAESLKQKKTDLIKRWKEQEGQNNEPMPDDSIAVAVAYVTKSSKRQLELGALMQIIETRWKPNGKDIAWRKFQEAKKRKNKPGDIDFTPFEEFFSESEAGPKLGFYFWPSKNGWYAVDIDGDDEPLGSTYLTDPKCLNKLRSEFADKKNKDSGLSEADEKLVLDQLTKAKADADNLVKEKLTGGGKDTVASFFKKNAENKWAKLDEKTTSKLNLIFGAGVGKYLYRFVPGKKPEKDRVYMILIKDQQPEENLGVAGYMEIGENGFGSWNAFDSVDKLKMLVDKMEVEDINKELGKAKIEAGETVSNDEMLRQTAGMLNKIKGFSEKSIILHDLNKYYDDIKAKLEIQVKKEKGNIKNLDKIVKARLDDIKSKVEAAIAKDEYIKETRTKHPEEKIKIRIDSSDKVTVDFDNPLKRGLLRKAKEGVKDAETSVEGITNSKMKELREKMKNGILGSLTQIPLLGGFIKGYIEKFFKDGIPKLLRGESAPITTMLLGIAGVSVTPALLGAKKYNSKKFESLLVGLFKNEQMKEADHKKKFTLTEAHKLKGYTIVIPKGKGVTLKKGAVLEADGGPLKGEGPKKKSRVPWASSAEHEVGKDQEIVIKDGTTIPAGTIITQMTVKKA